MSQRNKPVRQDYVAKIRYTNNLPPPPLNPKYIEYNTANPISQKTEAEQLLASLFRKENFQILMEKIDDQSGLELNLINNNGFLDYGKPSSIGQLTRNDQPIPLHPKDRALLRDAGIGKINKSEPGVSFLRRTEYISERSTPKTTTSAAIQTEEAKANAKIKNEAMHSLDADAQLDAVEETFTAANDSLHDFSKLQHPRKKRVKAVDTWPLLPDTSMMDNVLMNLRFLGSASIDRELKMLKRRKGDSYNERFQRQKQESAIFKPINSKDGEWMSMFQVPNEDEAGKLHQVLNSTEPEKPVNLLDLEDDTGGQFQFKFAKNYEMSYQEYPHLNQELAVKFVPESAEEKDGATTTTRKKKVAYYLPITGKVELKKYRTSTNREINKFVKEKTFDLVNFKLREPTTNELKSMDRARSQYDPMEYEGDDDEDEGDEGEQEGAEEYNHTQVNVQSEEKNESEGKSSDSLAKNKPDGEGDGEGEEGDGDGEEEEEEEGDGEEEEKEE
ncbi:uncharacterized protein LODBEIA_P36570 [Lodderomyces beijingensis]|uniref:RNA polymerase II-associated protein 1 n=1 Tax=Lodderomyces beijingensis TaxID=1775926 RepID=A0ABP0ZMQ2_9ASCO